MKTGKVGERDTHRLALLPNYSSKEHEDRQALRQLLDTDTVLDGSQLAGKRVLVTGANHGLGPALVQQLAQSGALVAATCRESSKELDASLAAGTQKIFSGLDVRSDPEVAAMAAKVNGSIDIIVNNVGYDYAGNETLDKLNAKEDLFMFDIDAEGPLRVTKALRAAGKLQNGSKVVTISSQGGSATWMSIFGSQGWPSRDYGYHMSKASLEMGMVVLAGELNPEGITVITLHPGFVQTDMTVRFSDTYETGGAVDMYSPNDYKDRQLLDIDAVFKGSQLAGKRVLVTGSNRGMGLGLVRQLAQNGALVVATCRESSKELNAALAVGKHEILTGVDVTSDPEVAAMAAKVNGSVDILVNNAGYYYEGNETLDKLNAKEDLLMFDIDAEGPLRVTKALRAAGKLQNGSKVVTISSQGGSVTWMSEFARRGWPSQDYGYHMSKAASNRGMAVLAGELKPEGITVITVHPGFVETDMTVRFSEAYETGGAVDINTAAKRVLHQANVASMRTTGSFLNCEDGLLIPW